MLKDFNLKTVVHLGNGICKFKSRAYWSKKSRLDQLIVVWLVEYIIIVLLFLAYRLHVEIVRQSMYVNYIYTKS